MRKRERERDRQTETERHSKKKCEKGEGGKILPNLPKGYRQHFGALSNWILSFGVYG